MNQQHIHIRKEMAKISLDSLDYKVAVSCTNLDCIEVMHWNEAWFGRLSVSIKISIHSCFKSSHQKWCQKDQKTTITSSDNFKTYIKISAHKTRIIPINNSKKKYEGKKWKHHQYSVLTNQNQWIVTHFV